MRKSLRTAKKLPSLQFLGILSIIFSIFPIALTHANPNLEGTRHLSMGTASRASTYGTNAFLNNAAGMGFIPQFTVEPLYQVNFESNTHSIAVIAMDSLNSSRVAIGLGYSFLYGRPQISYNDSLTGLSQQQRLTQMGHEVGLAVSINVVKGWLSLGIKPKYQFLSLRYRDHLGTLLHAHDRLSAFGLDAAIEVSFRAWVQLAVTGYNLVGPHEPAWTEEQPLQLTSLAIAADSLNVRQIDRVSAYPRMLSHGLAVFPTQSPDFSINFDGSYDFTSFRNQDFTRMTFAAGGEYVIRNIPIRLGGYWDSRGRGKEDDRGYISFGLGYVQPASPGKLGIDVGLGVNRQITGLNPETFLGVHVGMRIHPDI